ncbi:MAG TPA: TadE/TadG family type IV pilus assembly protein [Rhizomicrobium sp.]|jgi:Flp pilus assembly protein TadG|nr:TadE/TadG family type IV pilus assembly protein [Rhizomicrobium sp.]
MLKPFWRRLQDALPALSAAEGLAGIEFAFLAPILMLLTLCTVDVGVAAYSVMQVENAAQAGSEYAAVHGFNSAGISNVVTSATSLSGLSASPAPSQFCGCPSGNSISSATCGSTCTDGSIAGGYVTVSATATYKTLIPYPMLPASFTFVNSATARIQ